MSRRSLHKPSSKPHRVWTFLQYFSLILVILLDLFLIWQNSMTPPLTGDWQAKVAVQSTAEFHDNLVTVRNVRNFKYPTGDETKPEIAYYDQTYDLDKLTKVWYVTELFTEKSIAAHTFMSFEFSDGKFLSITIEARLRKDQVYSIPKGLLHTYPLIYIAADERDAIYVRANVRNSKVYLYPVKADHAGARSLLVDMLSKMNELTVYPQWYNTFWANCTSMIAYHVNKLFPGRLPRLAWQEWVTGYADGLALKSGLLDTDLPLAQARAKFLISDKAQKVGYAEEYSRLIRE